MSHKSSIKKLIHVNKKLVFILNYFKIRQRKKTIHGRTLRSKIRCLYDQIILNQTNQISFKEMGPFAP